VSTGEATDAVDDASTPELAEELGDDATLVSDAASAPAERRRRSMLRAEHNPGTEL
jgi:hypothetical protein